MANSETYQIENTQSALNQETVIGQPIYIDNHQPNSQPQGNYQQQRPQQLPEIITFHIQNNPAALMAQNNVLGVTEPKEIYCTN